MYIYIYQISYIYTFNICFKVLDTLFREEQPRLQELGELGAGWVLFFHFVGALGGFQFYVDPELGKCTWEGGVSIWEQ